jgi:hypothetical protein
MSDLLKVATFFFVIFAPYYIYSTLKNYRSIGWENKESMYKELIGSLIILYITCLIIGNAFVGASKYHPTIEDIEEYDRLRQEEQLYNSYRK